MIVCMMEALLCQKWSYSSKYYYAQQKINSIFDLPVNSPWIAVFYLFLSSTWEGFPFSWPRLHRFLLKFVNLRRSLARLVTLLAAKTSKYCGNPNTVMKYFRFSVSLSYSELGLLSSMSLILSNFFLTLTSVYFFSFSP